jgi:DNA-binding CsgD family transcriptional regulator/tetratricopeptide (TPR) repeat protein
MELLERAEQLATLADQLAQAGRGGRFVLVSGEAGAGKSALIREFVAQHAGDADTLIGRCDDLFAPRPLGPLADMARGRPGSLATALAAGDESAAFDAFLSLLASPPSPLVVVLEDLQWADEATLDLLNFVARRLDVLSCLIIATHRDDLAPNHPLRRVSGSFVGPAVTRLHVPPLSIDAVRLLLGDRAGDAESFHAQTGGNPFFVVEALQCQPGELPATVRDVILARTVGLTGPARDALDAAAVLGRIDENLVQVVGDCDSRAVDECVAAGLLVDVGGHQTFRHDIARQAIEDAMTPLRRRQLHARALTALGADADVVQLAHHAIAAGDREAIVEFATRAGDQCVTLGAHRQATILYGSAAVHADRLEPAAQLRLHQARAKACLVSERTEEAVAAGEAALALMEDDPDLGGFETWMSDVYWLADRKQESWAILQRALERLEADGESSSLAFATAKLACHHLMTGEYEQVADYADAAREMAERQDDEETAIYAMGIYGAALTCVGDKTGLDLMEDVVRRAKPAGLVVEVCRTGSNLGEAYLGFALPARAMAVFDEILPVAVESDLQMRISCVTLGRAHALTLLGRWDEASLQTRVVAEQPDLMSTHRCMIAWFLGRIRARRGDPAPFELLETEEQQYIAPVRLSRAEAAWLAGDDDAARREVAEVLPHLTVLEMINVRGAASWAHRLGLEWTADFSYDPIPEVVAGNARAVAEFWKARGCIYESADALSDSNEVDDLREAHDRLTEMGARPLAMRVARKLRDLGARDVPRGPRATTRANAAGLTARELEIAALLIRGMTNTEIADELVLSQKTVEHHVSAVLSKLAVRNRRQVAHAAQEFGIELRDTTAAS